jgi:ATPase family protein associated with various cellular activities (AAA)
MDDTRDRDGLADALKENARDLEAEFEWFARVLDARLKSYFAPGGTAGGVLELPPPDLDGSPSNYACFVRRHALPPDVRLVIVLALIPHVRPQLLDVLWSRNEATQRGFTEFGGMQGLSHGGFIPTGETAAFLLAGDDLSRRFEVTRLFEGDHFLAAENVLHLSPVSQGESQLSGVIALSRQHLHQFTTGLERKPDFSSDFPARLIRTQFDWEQLVLPQPTLDHLEEIRHWILHGETLLRDWDMEHKLRPGFTSLFHGPPGTGKTLSACLLGRRCGCDVYKVDLSMIVSKYVGETEKNLARVFDMAEHRRWILFFDEADALFGRRTKVDNSHDRFANQEISYLLQRIEEFDGVVILASNFKTNIDDAFVRRFQSVVHFPIPRSAERLRIWKEAFSPRARLDPRVDLSRLSEKYELSGGTIMNVVRYASLMALSRGGNAILPEDLEDGTRRELLKEGRAF